MAGLMNLFDLQGQGGQMFNAGMQVGRIKSPVAGLGDSIRQVMDRGRALRDQQMQAGQTMMQSQFEQNLKVQADADKVKKMQELYGAGGGSMQPQIEILDAGLEDPANPGQLVPFFTSKTVDLETGLPKYSTPAPVPNAIFKQKELTENIRAKQRRDKSAIDAANKSKFDANTAEIMKILSE